MVYRERYARERCVLEGFRNAIFVQQLQHLNELRTALRTVLFSCWSCSAQSNTQHPCPAHAHPPRPAPRHLSDCAVMHAADPHVDAYACSPHAFHTGIRMRHGSTPVERNASCGRTLVLSTQGIEHSTPVVLNVVVASFAGGIDSELIWMDAIECLCVGVAPWHPPIVTTRQSPRAEPQWLTHRSELRRRIRQFLSAA
jgi:hypothetical protein